MTKSERLRRRIIFHLRHVWVWPDGGNLWKSFDKLAAEIGAPVASVKREVRRMARSGRLRHSVMCNADGIPAGSGYFLVFAWETYNPGRAEDPAPDEFEVDQ